MIKHLSGHLYMCSQCSVLCVLVSIMTMYYILSCQRSKVKLVFLCSAQTLVDGMFFRMTPTFIMLLVLSTKYRASCQIYTKLIFSLGCHRCPSLNFTTKNNLLRQILLSILYAKMVTLSFSIFISGRNPVARQCIALN